MKKYLFYLIFFLIIGCTNNRVVYWCGDHPCINKKEKESYFKKTMTVETKNMKKELYKKDSEIEKLMKQAQINEKKRIKNEKEFKKQSKLDEKRRQKEEKRLAKQIRLEEKERKKKEKKLLNKEKKDKKKQDKKVKKISKIKSKITEKKITLETHNNNAEINLSNFDNLVKKISEINKNKSYPSINNIED